MWRRTSALLLGALSRTGARDDQGLRVEVSDNGVGIHPDKAQHVFDLVTRADTSVPGSGIGLATVRAAVEAHGGSVGVRSVERQGSTFWFVPPQSGHD